MLDRLWKAYLGYNVVTGMGKYFLGRAYPYVTRGLPLALASYLIYRRVRRRK